MTALSLAATAPKASCDEDGSHGISVHSTPAVKSNMGTNKQRPFHDPSHWTCSFDELDGETAAVFASGESKHGRHWWHFDYRIYICILVICSVCAFSLLHPPALLARRPSKYVPLALAKRDATDRPSFNAPLIEPATAIDTPVRPFTQRQEVLDDLPAWADYDAIDSKTLRSSNTLAPVFLHHLLEANTPAPYDRVHLVSAFLDPRPLVMDERHEIMIHGVLNGVEIVNTQKTLTYPEGIVECSIFVRAYDGTSYAGDGKVTAMIAHSRRHQYMTLSQAQFVCSLAMIPEETYRAINWQEAEIFATLTSIGQAPPADVFIHVRSIAPLDVEKHRSGRGPGAICIAPLHGELYAPVLRDHLSYQRSLGFTKVYAYLLDPGPITLAVVRELAATDPDFVPIRWGIPQEWATKARTAHTHMNHDFAVDPSEWNVRGIDVLDPQREELLGVADDGDHPTVGIWYWGQSIAGQDCHMRAMADGVRWVSTIDWDEYFVLQPSGQSTWSAPPRDADPETAMLPFRDWLREVPQHTWDPQGHWHYILHPRTISRLKIDFEEATQGLLPSAILFSHSFGQEWCRSRGLPPSSAVLDEVMDTYGKWDWKQPGVSVPTAFSTSISSAYMDYGQRSKKILDPWAYFLDGTHTTILGYGDYSLGFSGCTAPGKTTRQRRICAQAILHAFGSHAIPVPLPKMIADRGPQLARPTDPDLEFASGALRHYRVDWNHTVDIFEITKDLTEMPTSLLNSAASRRVRAKMILGACRSHKFQEDWSMVTIMEQSLKWILQDRAEAPTKPRLEPVVIPAKPTFQVKPPKPTPAVKIPAKYRPAKAVPKPAKQPVTVNVEFDDSGVDQGQVGMVSAGFEGTADQAEWSQAPPSNEHQDAPPAPETWDPEMPPETRPEDTDFPSEPPSTYEVETPYANDEMVDRVEPGMGGRLGQTIAANPYGLTLVAVGAVVAFYLVERRKERSRRPRKGYVMVEQRLRNTDCRRGVLFWESMFDIVVLASSQYPKMCILFWK
ncbi:BZ3500_MvSof-1268-A1-R1_Chr1-3g01713 [Microbotryum saponariae]|uniref:BZ3500_MvSof-1268-A1-R1_Chr1-3g01713 protein n=1 Tax=Microbotryum saponariae TaxID=289078 RepID=A0A2X0KCD1_9BASI|nr:BZ3500_MvSof-1268-A1-R1_Chr1-3g01713 [Microbotryum saponariae]SCZ94403.1 BZ3501_MvSof-1269-A2-R1_Chr1-3g01314 [Microbotryum saponariae]